MLLEYLKAKNIGFDVFCKNVILSMTILVLKFHLVIVNTEKLIWIH